MKVAGIIKHSLVNGPGIRYVIFFQGCPHHCIGCQNPETHDFSKGEELEPEDFISAIKGERYIEGITLSGGDPLYQPEDAMEIAKAAKELGLNVWCYTGHIFENIVICTHTFIYKALEYVDVLVDAPFIKELRMIASDDMTEEEKRKCIYRGSTNQRLIDVPESIRRGETVEWCDF